MYEIVKNGQKNIFLNGSTIFFTLKGVTALLGFYDFGAFLPTLMRSHQLIPALTRIYPLLPVLTRSYLLFSSFDFSTLDP